MLAIEWTSSKVTVAGNELHLRRGGQGKPLLLLHRDIGTLDALPFYDLLAQTHEVLIPDHPGYGTSPRAEWIGNVRDIAALYRAMLGKLRLKDAGLVGLGFGGWIAAEMASFAPYDTPHLVLVGAMGLKPPTGEILDQALISYIEYVRAGFHDPEGFDRVFGARPSTEQLIQWDLCREMSFRVAWKPYMYNDSLPHLLPAIHASTLVISSEHDQVVPRSVGTLYARELDHAHHEIIGNAGHLVEHEQPAALAAMITAFLASH